MPITAANIRSKPRGLPSRIPAVLGHKVELVTADHQNKPDLAVSRAALV
jgi:hypothetical protein